MKVVAIVPARGGSKGVSRKNVRLVAGRPLIAWTIAVARESGVFSRVVVSTDDPEIARVSVEWGAEVPFLRPAELATDTATSIDVVEHALRELGPLPDAVMLLQPTSPLRAISDIKTAVSMLNDTTEAVVSITAAAHPPDWFCTIADDGTLARFDSKERLVRRQDARPMYQLNGAIYLVKTEPLLRERTFTPAKTRPYVMPQERSIDIDTEWDLHVAALVLRATVSEMKNV